MLRVVHQDIEDNLKVVVEGPEEEEEEENGKR